jgi:hypothetical protein
MKKIIAFFILALIPAAMTAQRNEIYSSQIRTLQVVAGDNWLSPPVVKLNSADGINISFDDMTHTYHRYVYHVQHCEADWTPSTEIFESDYLEGFNDLPIENYQNSINTTVLYTHYSFSLPNSRCRLKLSGNYRITVKDDDSGENVFTACFMVYQPQMSVAMSATTNTDIDVNISHQQVDMQLDYNSINVTDPATQIYTVVMQNGRWDNAVVNVKPNYINNDRLTWTHNRSLIFDGSNEYHKFEMLDVHHPTMGVENIIYEDGYYHCEPFPCSPRINYLYDEDANGSFYIRNSDNTDNDVTCDYLWVHYVMNCDRAPGNVYVNGVWTNDLLADEYKMTYNDIDKRYEANILQKQGYYSYQYLMTRDDGSTTYLPAEGSFFQTENSYQALVYFKSPSDRTYRMTAYANIKFK